jgi:Spy/CpxP family protein refolding chaperone
MMKKRVLTMSVVMLVVFALACPGYLLTECMAKEKKATTEAQSLTPDQKAAIKKRVEDGVNQLKNITPEQKAEMQQKLMEAVDRLKNITPEQKQQIADAIALFKSLTPDQQKKLLKFIFE